LLLAKKALVNARDNNGQTALMLASREGYREVKKLLLRAGAK
jgi:ankyrin repeat protein